MERTTFDTMRGEVAPGELRLTNPPGGRTRLVLNGLVVSVADNNGEFRDFDFNMRDLYPAGFNGDAIVLGRWDDVAIVAPEAVQCVVLRNEIVQCDM